MGIVIDPKRIEAELQDLYYPIVRKAGRNRKPKFEVKVKLDKHLNVANSISQTDHGYLVKFNPSKIRSSNTLEAHLNFCRQRVTS